MDFLSNVKSELLRPLITLVIPGAFFIGPWILIVGYHVPRIAKFWDERPSAFVAIITICVFASGLILEDIGARIESGWDNRLKDSDNWDKYLQLETKDEIVGQRYLRTILLRMKFELSMAPALISLCIGIIWLDSIYEMWTWKAEVPIYVFVLLLAAYLVFESYSSACLLKKTRKLIIDAVAEKQRRAISKPAAEPAAEQGQQQS